MTRRRYDNRDTSFGRWVRNHPGLKSSLGYDVQDFDHVYPNDFFDEEKRGHKLYINHQFLHGKLMLVEEKQYKSERTLAQKDTFGVFDQWCRYASSMEVKRVIEGRPTNVEYWGYFVIQFEKTSPTNGKIWINGQLASENDLLKLLQFNRKIANKYGVSQHREQDE